MLFRSDEVAAQARDAAAAGELPAAADPLADLLAERHTRREMTLFVS